MCCPYKNDLNLIKQKQKNDHLRLHQCKSFCKCKPFHKIKSVGKNFLNTTFYSDQKEINKLPEKSKLKYLQFTKKYKNVNFGLGLISPEGFLRFRRKTWTGDRRDPRKKLN